MVLKIEGIEFRRGNFHLRIDRLEVNSIVAILGRNGSGKTTLLDVIAGVHRARGRVEACGRDVSNLPQEKRKLAYIQSIPIEPPGRVEKFLKNVAKLHGAEDQIREVVNQLGIIHLLSKTSGFSTGQRQLINLAAALLTKPCAFLMDEPTSHLDWVNKKKFMDIVKNLDKPVLYVTHDPFEAMYVANSICVMESGIIKRCISNSPSGLEIYRRAEELLQ